MVVLLGVPFDHVTTAETIDCIKRMIASGRPHYLATANLDFVVQARQDVEFRRILFDADLVLCDGAPLVWASRWLGHRLPERIAGASLVPLILGEAARSGYRPFFLGGRAHTTAQAVARMKRDLPNLDVAGFFSPPFTSVLEMDHADINARIRDARPDLLFVCFGSPKQEKWIAMNYRELGVPVSIGVGGTIDFLAGRLPRAPIWMQRAGMEWMFRVAQEPRRLIPRYARDLSLSPWPFLSQSWIMRRRLRRARSIPERTLSAKPRERWLEISCPEYLDREAVQHHGAQWDDRLRETPNLLLMAADVKAIDSSGAGFLVRQHKLAKYHGGVAVLVAPSRAVRRALRLMRLLDFFLVAPDVPGALSMLSRRPNESAVFVEQPEEGRLVWKGEVTASSADHVWQITKQFILGGAKKGLSELVDVHGVTFIDTSGLSVMIRARRLAVHSGIDLRFVGVQPNVRNVARLARQEDTLLAGAPNDGRADGIAEGSMA